MVGFAGGEGIGAGQKVAEFAVTVDEGVDGGLLEADFRRQACQRGEGDRLSAYIESFEKGLPIRGKMRGILLPVAVKIFEPCRIEIGEKRHPIPPVITPDHHAVS
jgi:hypothetical protein